MSLVSQVMIGRMEKFIGRVLSPAETDEIRRISELIAVEEHDPAWAVILVMWGARTDTTTALTQVRDDIRAGVDAWTDQVESGIKAIDEKRRSMARQVAVQAEANAAEISQAAERGTAALSARLTAMESQVATMTAATERAMAGATGALKAAQKRDLEIQTEVKTLADRYAREMAERLDIQTEKALHRAEFRLGHAAEQARIAGRPLLVVAYLMLFGILFGVVTTTVIFEGLVMAH